MHDRLPRTDFYWLYGLKISIIILSLLLSSPDFKSHSCKASDFVPTGPKIQESFHDTNSTTSFVILKGIKIGVLSYTSSVERYTIDGNFFKYLSCNTIIHLEGTYFFDNYQHTKHSN